MASRDWINGGRDRDRTCDPYHVKVAILAAIAFYPHHFFFASKAAAHLLPHA
jgi:hypothetical protein